MRGNFLHAKRLCFHNLTGSLEYLNDKEFIAPLFDWEIKLINRLKENFNKIIKSFKENKSICVLINI